MGFLLFHLGLANVLPTYFLRNAPKKKRQRTPVGSLALSFNRGIANLFTPPSSPLLILFFCLVLLARRKSE